MGSSLPEPLESAPTPPAECALALRLDAVTVLALEKENAELPGDPPPLPLPLPFPLAPLAPGEVGGGLKFIDTERPNPNGPDCRRCCCKGGERSKSRCAAREANGLGRKEEEEDDDDADG